MKKLVYLSFPLLGVENKPDWVDPVKLNPTSRKEGWGFYDPWHPMKEQDASLRELLGRPPAPTFRDNQRALKLDVDLFKSPAEVAQRFMDADVSCRIENVTFRSLYVLLRSDIVLIDLSSPSYEGHMDLLYAHLGNVPSIGITDRFVSSPWSAGKVTATITPADSNDVIRQIMAHDRAVTAPIEANHRELISALELADQKASELTAKHSDSLPEGSQTQN